MGLGETDVIVGPAGKTLMYADAEIVGLLYNTAVILTWPDDGGVRGAGVEVSLWEG